MFFVFLLLLFFFFFLIFSLIPFEAPIFSLLLHHPFWNLLFFFFLTRSFFFRLFLSSLFAFFFVQPFLTNPFFKPNLLSLFGSFVLILFLWLLVAVLWKPSLVQVKGCNTMFLRPLFSKVWKFVCVCVCFFFSGCPCWPFKVLDRFWVQKKAISVRHLTFKMLTFSVYKKKKPEALVESWKAENKLVQNLTFETLQIPALDLTATCSHYICVYIYIYIYWSWAIYIYIYICCKVKSWSNFCPF